MHIRPTTRSRDALWHSEDSRHGLMALGVWTEQRSTRGEDAEPLLLVRRRTGRGILGVFDGAGGAGSAIAGSTTGSPGRTGAWVGSRVVRAGTEEWFVTTEDRDLLRSAPDLHDVLAAHLGEVHTARRRKIGGTMRRELPTTLAAIDFHCDDSVAHWRAFWAGDSRCYLLTQSDGLQQLSTDDTESSDALELLNSDPPMTNLIAADGRFVINQHDGECPKPCVLLVATDGFFGYVATPAIFEYVLLDALRRAASLEEWGRNLIDCVLSYTGDDASLALISLGGSTFTELRASFDDRIEFLAREHWNSMQGLEGRDALVAARNDSWSRYRYAYERRMPHRKLAEAAHEEG